MKRKDKDQISGLVFGPLTDKLVVLRIVIDDEGETIDRYPVLALVGYVAEDAVGPYEAFDALFYDSDYRLLMTVAQANHGAGYAECFEEYAIVPADRNHSVTERFINEMRARAADDKAKDTDKADAEACLETAEAEKP